MMRSFVADDVEDSDFDLPEGPVSDDFLDLSPSAPKSIFTKSIAPLLRQKSLADADDLLVTTDKPKNISEVIF